MNNLLLILAIMILGNGNIPLLDNRNKSNKSTDIPIKETDEVKIIDKSDNSNSGQRNGSKVRKIKKIKKKTRNKKPQKNILKFDMTDVNKGINLMDLNEEDLDRGMEIISRTKKYMNKDERNILIKLESVLDLVKGIKKLNNIDILSEEDESDFFRSMDEDDKKNMMIKEILEVFPEKRKQSVEKALEMKKMIDLFAEMFLPDGDEGGGFSLSSLADINNLGSVSNLKLLGNLLRSLDDDEEDNDETTDEYIEVDDTEEEEEYICNEDLNQDEYLEMDKSITNSKNRKRRARKNKQIRKKKNHNANKN